ARRTGTRFTGVRRIGARLKLRGLTSEAQARRCGPIGRTVGPHRQASPRKVSRHHTRRAARDRILPKNLGAPERGFATSAVTPAGARKRRPVELYPVDSPRLAVDARHRARVLAPFP